MRGLIVAAATAVLLCGCVAPRPANYRAPSNDELRVPYAQSQPPKPVRTVLTPTCKGAVDCGQKWARAQEVLQSITFMRLRLVTEGRLETFAANRPPSMTGSVVKYPISADEYELRVDLECSRPAQPCDEREKSGVDAFNAMLGGKIVQMDAAGGSASTRPAP